MLKKYFGRYLSGAMLGIKMFKDLYFMRKIKHSNFIAMHSLNNIYLFLFLAKNQEQINKN